jgi:hypothetical protein
MTLDHHVARRVLRKPSSRPSYAGWILDSITADSAHRFSCLRVRHGSSVPGPLEARKRGVRRRNTSLASATRIEPPIETGVLSALSRKVEWWNVSCLFEPRTGAAECEIFTYIVYPLILIISQQLLNCLPGSLGKHLLRTKAAL